MNPLDKYSNLEDLIIGCCLLLVVLYTNLMHTIGSVTIMITSCISRHNETRTRAGHVTILLSTA